MFQSLFSLLVVVCVRLAIASRHLLYNHELIFTFGFASRNSYFLNSFWISFVLLFLNCLFTRSFSIHLAVSLELDLFLLCRFQSVFIEFFDFERKNCSQLQLYSTVQRIFLDCVVSFNNMEQEIGKMLVFLAHEKFSSIRTAFPTFLCTSAV